VALPASRAPARPPSAAPVAAADTAAVETPAPAPPTAPRPGAPTAAHHDDARAVLATTIGRRPTHDPAESRRRLALGAQGTYVGDVLLAYDSSVVRWRDRVNEPLRVWIAPGTRLDGWSPAFDAAVRAAFTAWAGAGAPMRVTFVVDSARAEVPVVWIDHFADERIGNAQISGRDGEIISGNITLAVRSNTGAPLDEDIIQAVTLHEVGHLLGLSHTTADSASIMRPRAAHDRLTLSAADRATMRLLYSLPPGTVK
jgi:hypothetical protein